MSGAKLGPYEIQASLGAGGKGVCIAAGSLRRSLSWWRQVAGLPERGTYPIWRNDGKELFFLSLSWVVTAVPIGVEGGQLKLGAPQALFRTSSAYYDVAPGGQKFLSILVGDQGSKPITLVTNWSAELKK